MDIGDRLFIDTILSLHDISQAGCYHSCNSAPAVLPLLSCPCPGISMLLLSCPAVLLMLCRPCCAASVVLPRLCCPGLPLPGATPDIPPCYLGQLLRAVLWWSTEQYCMQPEARYVDTSYMPPHVIKSAQEATMSHSRNADNCTSFGP